MNCASHRGTVQHGSKFHGAEILLAGKHFLFLPG